MLRTDRSVGVEPVRSRPDLDLKGNAEREGVLHFLNDQR